MQNAVTVLDAQPRAIAGMVAGEPGDQKWSRRVREGGVGKGPTRAPRRHPTSADGHAQVSGVRRRGTRVIWRRLDCLKPNLQQTQRNVRRNDTCYRRMLCDGSVLRLSQPSGRGALSSEGN